MKSFHLLIVLLLLLAACAKPPAPAPTSTATLPPTAAPTAEPTAVPGVTLAYHEAAQIEMVTPAGRHVYIDVFNTSMLDKKTPGPDDILLTTHLHDDHFYRDFQESFPGKQLFTQEGRIELPDISITGVAAAHNSNDPIKAEGSNDYIYMIDVAGLRIAHFGDIGQIALTETQLAALGTVDVAIMQFANSYSSMDSNNLKGFKLMDQVKPRLIIPTHSDQATIKIAASRWKGYYSDSRAVTLSKDTLPANESILVLGNLAVAYGALFKLDAWK